MSLLTQAYLLEKFGPRMTVKQMAEVLSISDAAIYNQVSAGTFPVKTYVQGGKRWADYRDVAQVFDDFRALSV